MHIVFIIILINLAILAAAVLLPVITLVLIRLDYIFLILVVAILVIGTNVEGVGDYALLRDFELHTVFIILIHLGFCFAWFLLQQIRIIKIYPFRIAACALSAFLLAFIAAGLIESVDTIWQWTIGILNFLVLMYLRNRRGDLFVGQNKVIS